MPSTQLGVESGKYRRPSADEISVEPQPEEMLDPTHFGLIEQDSSFIAESQEAEIADARVQPAGQTQDRQQRIETPDFTETAIADIPSNVPLYDQDTLRQGEGEESPPQITATSSHARPPSPPAEEPGESQGQGPTQEYRDGDEDREAQRQEVAAEEMAYNAQSSDIKTKQQRLEQEQEENDHRPEREQEPDEGYYQHHDDAQKGRTEKEPEPPQTYRDDQDPELVSKSGPGPDPRLNTGPQVEPDAEMGEQANASQAQYKQEAADVYDQNQNQNHDHNEKHVSEQASEQRLWQEEEKMPKRGALAELTKIDPNGGPNPQRDRKSQSSKRRPIIRFHSREHPRDEVWLSCNTKSPR
jgi:hypothetical protein